MITVTEKGRENKKPLIIENVNKIAIAKVAKALSTIDLERCIVGQLIMLT